MTERERERERERQTDRQPETERNVRERGKGGREGGREGEREREIEREREREREREVALEKLTLPVMDPNLRSSHKLAAWCGVACFIVVTVVVVGIYHRHEHCFQYCQHYH